MRNILDWSVEEWICAVFVAVIIALAALGITALAANHRVRGYYVTSGGSAYGGSCVYADFPWESDNAAFCSADAQSVLDFLTKANAGLAGRK